MMETTQAINTIVFPIFAFLLMFWHNERTLKKLEISLRRNTEALKVVLVALTQCTKK